MRVLILTAKPVIGDSLAGALARRGHEVTVAGAHLRARRRAGLLKEAARVAIAKAGKADVIILEGALYDVPVALAAHRLSGVPLVLQLQGYWPLEAEEGSPARYRRALKSLMMTRLASSSAHVVYVSRWLRDRYLNTPRVAMLREKPSSVVYLGPDPFFRPSETRGAPGADSVATLCYAGNFVYYDKVRGVLLLLDAFAQALEAVPGLRLNVCSEGRHRDLLLQKADDLRLGDRVVFTGRVAKEELREHYRRSDIFVYASFLDGCPGTVLEAQACGTPVVVTTGSGAAELVEDGVSGIVCEPDAGSLAAAIVRLVRNPALRREMGLRAIEHVTTRLSWDATGAGFHEVLSGLGETGRRKGRD